MVKILSKCTNLLFRLYLTDNLIEHFPWSCLEDLPNLTHLSLNNNRLLTLPGNDDVVMTRLSHLTDLGLHPNDNLRCDCDVIAFARYLATSDEEFVARWTKLGCKSKSENLHPEFPSLNHSDVYENGVCYRPRVYVIFKRGESFEGWGIVNQTLVANSSVTFNCLVDRRPRMADTTYLKLSVFGWF